MLYIIAVFAPLAGPIIAGLLGRHRYKASQPSHVAHALLIRHRVNAYVARRFGAICLVDAQPVGDDCDLHVAGCIGAGGHEEVDRLFLGRPHGRRHDWHLHFQRAGNSGALFQMLSHGFVSAVPFLIVGVVYDRIHTREIARYGGLADRMPSYALVFMVFMIATMGLRGTSGFVGEVLVIIASFRVSVWLTLLGGMGMILGAAYMLYLYGYVIFSRLTKQDLRDILDLGPREWVLFAPLIVLTLWMGVYPTSFGSFCNASVAMMVRRHAAVLAREIPVAPAHICRESAIASDLRPKSGQPWEDASPDATRLPMHVSFCGASGTLNPMRG